MALNKYMHPRNRYKGTKPSFLHLALKYPEFRAHTTQDESGKVFLDFKNADALRALTTCLLKEDFDLSVELPSDRLVPTLPLRLNYIHWLEDIVGKEPGKWGIDIGTGASCVYPLLAAKLNQWNFLATEADPENLFHAKKNVKANGLQQLIHVEAVTSDEALRTPIENFKPQTSTSDIQFDFCMCNPPFFADHMEAQAVTTSRKVERPEAGSVSTASPQECIALGGEVAFVRHMIEDSAVLREKVRVYSSMVGKKASLVKLKEDLRHNKVPKFSTTEFCQGKTMRWGIAWSFDKTVVFPKSEFDQRKEKPPLQMIVPRGAGGVEYTVHTIAGHIKNIMEELKIHCYQGKTAKSYSSITLTAPANTWCHQRRQRRQKQRELQQKGQTQTSESEQTSTTSQNAGKELQDGAQESQGDRGTEGGGDAKSIALDSQPGESSGLKRLREESDEQEENGVAEKRARLKGEEGGGDTKKECATSGMKTGMNDESDVDSSLNDTSLNSSTEGGSCEAGLKTNGAGEDLSGDVETAAHTDSSPKEYVLKCVMRLKRADEQIHLELEWLAGQSRELMHQLYTFLKNKLSRAD